MKDGDGLPIIGSLDVASRDRTMDNYLAALQSMLSLHQIAIRDASAKQRIEFDKAEKTGSINVTYVEILNSVIATHCTGVSQITGQLALLAAMGLKNVPEPPEIGSTQEMMH